MVMEGGAIDVKRPRYINYYRTMPAKPKPQPKLNQNRLEKYLRDYLRR